MILMNDMHPLGRLIKEAMDRNEWSYRTLEERSARAGHRMSHTNFQRLRDHEVRSIKGEVVRMLAIVLGRSEQVVAGAVLESMGIDLPGVRSTSLIDVVRTSNEISEYDQHLLESLLVVMTERQNDEDMEQQATVTSIRSKVDERPSAVADQKKAAQEPHPNIAPDQHPETT